MENTNDRISMNNTAEIAVLKALTGLSTRDAKEILQDVLKKIDDYSTVNESNEPQTLT